MMNSTVVSSVTLMRDRSPTEGFVTKISQILGPAGTGAGAGTGTGAGTGAGAGAAAAGAGAGAGAEASLTTKRKRPFSSTVVTRACAAVRAAMPRECREPAKAGLRAACSSQAPTARTETARNGRWTAMAGLAQGNGEPEERPAGLSSKS
mmetsp:Transcript_104658/g.254006  ORF Transcript_104658/g.254006 Transcript_104658/m.254006 type:complete len:150 (-) Transcript_104658:18-467(-)